MIIGTVRTQESRVYDSHAGYHQFHTDETQPQQQEPFGSFEVFWHDRRDESESGWYWWACFPGCLPDGEPSGPFAYSQQAHQDADEWAPEYDE
jgi:hypothetical protein